LLQQAGEIEADLTKRLKSMVGFRNIAVHDYQALNLEIVKAIVARNLDDLAAFARGSVLKHG
jgi:uncharacterized protein YutE (UPF0331/DUF86 family)